VAKDTIEENILKKANQKRLLGTLAIEQGRFTIEGLKENQLRNLIQVSTIHYHIEDDARVHEKILICLRFSFGLRHHLR
jgi:hypothetical protein